MSSEGSVTNWIGQLRAGDAAAAQKLWEQPPQLAAIGQLRETPAGFWPRNRGGCETEDFTATPLRPLFVAAEMLERLDDEHLRTIALYKLEGHSSDEIADKLGYERVTVQRKLRLIRQIWGQEASP
jgi:DNA-directed RNA polymerase specialized sigma24 family protein